jgi:hypothetical protein
MNRYSETADRGGSLSSGRRRGAKNTLPLKVMLGNIRQGHGLGKIAGSYEEGN